MSAVTDASAPVSALRRRASVLSRVLAAVPLGYAFSAGMVALGSVALPLATGLARSEAVFLASMLGFVVYLVALIWAFSERRLWMVWARLSAGTMLAFLLAHALKPQY